MDPFTGPKYSVQPAQLSPSALSFPPFGVSESQASITKESPVETTHYAGLPTPNTDSHPIRLLQGQGTAPESPFSGAVTGQSLSRGNVGQVYPAPKSRAFAVECVSPMLSHLALASLFSRREFESVKGPCLSHLSSMGKFVVGFTDFRDTHKALEKIQTMHPEWRVMPLTAREYAQETKDTVENASDFEGHVIIIIHPENTPIGIDLASIYPAMHGLVKGFGAVSRFKVVSLQNRAYEFFVEFCDTRDAVNAVAALNGAFFENFVLQVQHIHPDTQLSQDSLLKDAIHDISPIMSSRIQLGAPLRGRGVVLSPTGRSTVPMEDISELMDLLSPTPKSVGYDQHHDGNRFGDQRCKHPQNIVDVDRIRLGLDVRTTIMLRNIPNKVDLPLLKEIIDETSFGKYDFMYLRIDFANNCNVGYAFINFEDFVQARAGRTWNCFNSDKVAEVSYATIQGRDCLVQKFRNSSVMLEDPSFRPKLFHTGKGSLAGTEEPFPGPNNISKMRRSVENAEQVGLFAPRVTRDVRRGHGGRSDQPLQLRHSLSQRQLMLTGTPETSPILSRNF
ncbi:putative meiosis protein MEI2 [Talaromyces proteolyticus]|uniref:Meiosis protein MEI2 n=1 Tax=Talaromyces proteolyticus TaxID=1131652 RepID=A0AAD4KFG6_9EURO|nr:putative meiosis protein MEI2 [Talaromyces proteolyticus]KAH8689710.1 putative meiosis protein MEI2 [Talaromyces proteolyticus]